MKALDVEVAIHDLLRPRFGVMVDVGAHKGGFTLAVNRDHYESIVAIEPLPPAVEELKEHAASFGDKITIIQKAVSDRPGSSVLRVPVVSEETVWQWASIQKNFQEMKLYLTDIIEVEEFNIETVTIDSLGLVNVSSMKIDVEGAEPEALAGAKETISMSRPVISVELEERHRAGCTVTVPEFMAGLGYECFFVYKQRLLPLAKFNPRKMQMADENPSSDPISDPYVNCFFFVPAEEENLVAKARKVCLKNDASQLFRWISSSIVALLSKIAPRSK